MYKPTKEEFKAEMKRKGWSPGACCALGEVLKNMDQQNRRKPK